MQQVISYFFSVFCSFCGLCAPSVVPRSPRLLCITVIIDLHGALIVFVLLPVNVWFESVALNQTWTVTTALNLHMCVHINWENNRWACVLTLARTWLQLFYLQSPPEWSLCMDVCFVACSTVVEQRGQRSSISSPLWAQHCHHLPRWRGPVPHPAQEAHPPSTWPPPQAWEPGWRAATKAATHHLDKVGRWCWKHHCHNDCSSAKQIPDTVSGRG